MTGFPRLTPIAERPQLPREVELRIAALMLARGSSQSPVVLRELLRMYPHLTESVIRGVQALPDLGLYDAVMTLGRIALLRAGVRSQQINSDLARAADELPVWFVREVRRIDEESWGR